MQKQLTHCRGIDASLPARKVYPSLVAEVALIRLTGSGGESGFGTGTGAPP